MNALTNLKTPDAGTGEQPKLPATNDTEFVVAGELCRRIGLGRGALREHMKSGLIPYIQLGSRKYHFHWPTVREALLRRQRGAE